MQVSYIGDLDIKVVLIIYFVFRSDAIFRSSVVLHFSVLDVWKMFWKEKCLKFSYSGKEETNIREWGIKLNKVCVMVCSLLGVNHLYNHDTNETYIIFIYN